MAKAVWAGAGAERWAGGWSGGCSLWKRGIKEDKLPELVPADAAAQNWGIRGFSVCSGDAYTYSKRYGQAAYVSGSTLFRTLQELSLSSCLYAIFLNLHVQAVVNNWLE